MVKILNKKLKMKQEDKELLLKDLCARLPYKTYVKTTKGIGYVYAINTSQLIELSVANVSEYWSEVFNIDEIKPFLRPMSSMTEEEKNELKQISNEYLEDWTNSQTSIDKWKLDAKISYKRSVFYNSHYLDWNGLIELGLALEAPDGMYNIN